MSRDRNVTVVWDQVKHHWVEVDVTYTCDGVPNWDEPAVQDSDSTEPPPAVLGPEAPR